MPELGIEFTDDELLVLHDLLNNKEDFNSYEEASLESAFDRIVAQIQNRGLTTSD